MGFTLRAALDILPPGATVVVAELMPAVVDWNRGELGALANHPLDDPRVRVEVGDVIAVLHANRAAFDAVLLDVDNGPAALTTASNARLYREDGIAIAKASLKPGGVLAVWSASQDHPFARRLRAAGFTVRQEPVRGRAKRTGRRHTVLSHIARFSFGRVPDASPRAGSDADVFVPELGVRLDEVGHQADAGAVLEDVDSTPRSRNSSSSPMKVWFSPTMTWRMP